MPIRPQPRYYHCPACNWSKIVAPKSDVLGPGDFFDICPACGHAPLHSKAAGALQTLTAQVLSGLQRWLPTSK